MRFNGILTTKDRVEKYDRVWLDDSALAELAEPMNSGEIPMVGKTRRCDMFEPGTSGPAWSRWKSAQLRSPVWSYKWTGTRPILLPASPS